MSKRVRNHVIETESIRKVEQTIPSIWVCRPIDIDYGHDLLVEIFTDHGASTGLTFYVQSRGTDDETKKQKLSITTKQLDYFDSFDVPTLIVRYCTVTDEQFYIWNYDVGQQEKRSSQKTVTIVFDDSDRFTKQYCRTIPNILKNYRDDKYSDDRVRFTAPENTEFDMLSLANYPHLRTLILNSTPVVELEPLRGLRHLEWLEMNDTNISNLEPLKNCTSLSTLYAQNTLIDNLDFALNLWNLSGVNFAGTKIADISNLKNSKYLGMLDISNTKVEDLSPLSRSWLLHTLYMNNTPISDLSPLSNLQELYTLHCEKNPISDISPLSSMKRLRKVAMINLDIKDLTPLADLNYLEVLFLKGCPIEDIAPLRSFGKFTEGLVDNMIGIAYLNLEDTNVTDWSPVDHIDNVIGRPGDWNRKK